jgi:acetylornithine aminotransferase
MAVRKATAERSVCLMMDEVQSGFFRTGTYAFGFQHYGIVPDVVSLAKGMANGMPIGATCARGEYGDILQPGEHGSTFGGSALAVAAANATIDFLCEHDIAANVATLGSYLLKQLDALPHVMQVRGRGLMLGIQLDSEIAQSAVRHALDAGLVINATSADTIRLLPPLICDRQAADILLQKLSSVLSGL